MPPADNPSSPASVLPDVRTGTSDAGLWLAFAAGMGTAALAWWPVPEAAIAPYLPEVPLVATPPLTAGIAALGGVLAAWVGWAVDSKKRLAGLLVTALILAGSQSWVMADAFGTRWEPVSLAAAMIVGLVTAAVLRPRRDGVTRWFAGRLGEPVLWRLSAAQSAEFLLPDQREAAVLTCRMLNEALLREQMPAREFLRLMEAFRQTVSQLLLGRGALLDDAPESGTIRAFFGLPLALENHADTASASALILADAMKQFAIEHMHRDRPPVECGIGIACGTLTAGITGDAYRAAGDAVEQSRWLAGLNADYQTVILTDDATHRLAENGEDRPLEILNPPEGAAVEVHHLLATRGGLSQEAMARRDAFRDAIILLRAGHAEDALRRFADARLGLVHEDPVLERFVASAEHQVARDRGILPPPARPKARLSPRRIFRP